jgi:PAS domain S-box-containing protein
MRQWRSRVARATSGSVAEARAPALTSHIDRIQAYTEGLGLVDPSMDRPDLRRALAEAIRTATPEVLARWVAEIGPTFGIPREEWAGLEADQAAALGRWARHIESPTDVETYEYLMRHARSGFIAQFPASRFLSAQMRITHLLRAYLRATEPPERAVTLIDLLDQEFRKRMLHITDFFVEGRESLLLEQETSYRRWLDHAPACIIRADATDGRVFDVNLVGQRMLGYDRREIVGRLLRDLHPPVELTAVETLVDAMRTHGHQTRDGLHLKRRIGAPLPVYVSAGPIDYGDRHWLQLVYVDLSDRKQLEAQLVQSEKMAAIGQLAAGIAHELRNPLAIVMNALFDLRGALGPAIDAAVAEDLGIAEEEIGRAQSIIRNLLEFSRESGAELERIDLNDVLTKTVRLLRKYVEQSGVSIRTELGDIPPCVANANAIRQVLLNLVTNAVQAMPDGGELRLRTLRTEADRIRVEVADTGIGIPADQLASIFDPFYTTKAPGQGTGLGLSVVHTVVQRYGGLITVSSEPNVGTLFRIDLPCPCHDELPAPRPSSP